MIAGKSAITSDKNQLYWAYYKSIPFRIMDLNKFTGEKLIKLEHNGLVKIFLNKLLHSSHYDVSFEDRQSLGKIFQTIWKKNFDADAPVSGAHYSAIFVYEFNGEYFLHAGANIDPETKERLSSTEHRNCAEKQASISAARFDEMDSNYLKAIFLYRRPEKGRKYTAEKLLPCVDCYNKYVRHIQQNNGKLVIFYHEDREYNFFDDGYAQYLGEEEAFRNKKLSISSRIFTKSSMIDISSATQVPKRIYYKVFDKEDLNHINYEKTLGGRVTLEAQLINESTKLIADSSLEGSSDLDQKSVSGIKLQISKSRNQKESD